MLKFKRIEDFAAAIALIIMGITIGILAMSTDYQSAESSLPEHRTVQDLSDAEHELYHYATWALYQSVYLQIDMLDNPTDAQISEVWDRYHKNRGMFSKLLFNR